MPAVARVGVLDSRTVDRVAEFVEAHLHDVLTLDDLAAVAHLSTYHFARVFSRSTGLAPHRFVTSRRMDRARLMLWATDSSVEEVARAVGFSGAGHFRRVFRRFHGVTPAALRAASPSGARTARIDLVQTERPPPG
jgi:AraC family transcriptional regulator